MGTRAKGAAALLLAALVGVAVGRFLTPPRVETKTEVREVVRREVVEVIKEVKVAQKATTRRTLTRRETKPDGSSTTTRETTESTDTKEVATSQGDRVDSVVQETAAATTKVTERRASLALGALGGVVLAPQGASPVVGGYVSGRVGGPFFLGGWGITNTRDVHAAGVSLGLEF
jgi:hypothetical protein